jgi:type VI secretion system protein ImpA
MVSLMASLVLQNISGPVAVESPSGQNLEYQDRFLEMQRLGEIRPEMQFGATILPSKSPDWQRLLDCCYDLAHETRDLRVAISMLDALTHTSGWSGFSDGLEVISEWIVEFWDSLYPELDNEDGNDPTARLSVLSHLVSDELLVATLSQLPLCQHRTLGRLTYRDYQNAVLGGGAQGGARMSLSDIETLLSEAPRTQLFDQIRQLERAKKCVEIIDSYLIEQVGSGSWSGQRLNDFLAKVLNVLKSQHVTDLHSIQASVENNDSLDDAVSTTDRIPSDPPDEVLVSDASDGIVIPNSKQRSVISINSRAEATQAIDSICAYFEENEPASPVPLLLQRAKRLVSMSFVEILRELAPSEGQQLLQRLICSEKLDR